VAAPTGWLKTGTPGEEFRTAAEVDGIV